MNRRNSCFISALLAGTACIVPTFAAAADSIETVVVTASRRAQSVQDVPYNISAYSGKDLAASGAINMSTLTQAIPGLVTAGQTSGNNSNFVMRGLNANKTTDGGGQTFGTVPPVATYYGETPIFFPLRLTDIERVEVLRGPQGTLYGSGSLAGTIRFIPNRPDYESFAFGGTVSLSGTDNAGAPNESLEGMVNLPLVEGRLALRVVVALDNNAGFIDGNGLVQLDAAGVPVPRVAGNLASGFVVLPRQHGINATDAEQTRVELRGQVTDWLEAEVNYTHQRNHSDNPQATNPTFAGGMIDNSAKNFPGSLFPNVFGAAGGHVWPDGGAVFPANTRYDQSAYLNQPSDRSTDVLDLDVAADLGFASLTSSTSYYNVASHAILDESGLDEVSNGAASGNFAYAYSFYPRLMQRDRMTTGNNGTVEEVRLVSNWDEPIDYVVGGYYADQSQRRTNFDLVPGLSAFDTTVLPGIGGPFGHNNATMPDVIYTLNQRTQFSDRALFGELTWHVTPALQVTGGARTFWQTVGTQFAQTLPYCGKPCSTNPADPLGGASADSSTSTQGTIYKANASYKLGEDLMAYATYAEGFRHGGANGISLVGIYASLPSYLTYKPDTSANYEAGLKGTVFGQTFTAAAFLIHWDNFQFDGSTPSAFPIVINGSKARSEGLEFELAGALFDGLSYNAGYTYTQANVTQAFQTFDLPAFAGPHGTPKVQYDVAKGNPLPNAPKNTATLALNYLQPLDFDGWNLDWHLNGSYRSGTLSTFGPNSQKGRGFFRISPFTTWNVAVTLVGDVKWTASLFADNVFNAQGITGGVPASAYGTRGQYFAIETPRTVGIRLTYAQ